VAAPEMPLAAKERLRPRAVPVVTRASSVTKDILDGSKQEIFLCNVITGQLIGFIPLSHGKKLHDLRLKIQKYEVVKTDSFFIFFKQPGQEEPQIIPQTDECETSVSDCTKKFAGKDVVFLEM